MATNRINIPGLPPVEQRCPNCPTAEERAASLAAMREWKQEERSAFNTWLQTEEATKSLGPVSAEWFLTSTYRELDDRKPETHPEVGCFECDFTGLVPSEFGNALLDFIHRYTAA